MTMQWFIKPTGNNADLVKSMVTSELLSRSMSADPLAVPDRKGIVHNVYEVTSDMLNFMKNCRVSRGIDFRAFWRKLGSTGPVTEDKFIYAGKRKRKSVAKSKALQDLKKLKK